MKRKLIIAVVLALLVTFAFSVPAFAWDYEDKQINPNAQMDNGKTRGYSLKDMEDNGRGNSPIYPSTGEHIYVDTYSHSGDLAHLSILKQNGERVRKYSTEEMALADPGHGANWKAYDGCMFYFALEPMGWNIPDEKTLYFTVVLPDGKLKVKRKGTIRYQDIDFNDGTWRVQIPARVQIWVGGVGNGAADKLILNEDGSIWNSIKVLGGEIIITRV